MCHYKFFFSRLLLSWLAWKNDGEISFQAHPLSPLIPLMNNNTYQECRDSRTCADPQRQAEHSKQQACKAPNQYTIDHSDHASRTEKDLYPGGRHLFMAQCFSPIVIRRNHKV